MNISRVSGLAFVSSLAMLVAAPASAQDTAVTATIVVPAPPADATAAQTVVVTTTAVPPPPPAYAPAQTTPMFAPVLAPRDPATRPSFGASIGLHVAAAIAGPIGILGLVFGTIYAFGCSFGGGDCTISSVLLITGGVLETASVALGISASAVHAHTRARAAEWEGAMAFTPAVMPGGGGGLLTVTF